MNILNENMIRRLRNLRENINIAIYDSKDLVMRIIDVLSVGAALLGIAALVSAHGFDNDPEAMAWIHFVFRSILVFYYAKFIIKYIYSFSPKKYLKDYSLNGILLGIILIVLIYDATEPVFINEILTKFLQGSNPRVFSTIVEQVSFLILLVIEIGRASAFLPSTKLSAPKLFVISFLVLILTGTGLLMLPKMTVSDVSFPFVDALFTATSASCVTGLTVVDIADSLTIRGQMIIMLLIQLGGLNIITFATFFLILSKRSIGVKNQALIKDSLDANNFTDSLRLLKEIFYTTFVIEIAGAVLIFFNWANNTPFIDVYQKGFFSIFHSISAFNNAGFSLFEGGLFNEFCRQAYMLQIVIAVLIILGGLGFPVIKDIFAGLWAKKGVFNKKWALNTKIVVTTTVGLIVAGMTTFLIFEWYGAVDDRTVFGKFVSAFFQSVSARTAGFNSVDFSLISRPMLVMFIVLMFIGASPVSTGGGIKTSTFAVMILAALNTIRGRERLNIEHSQISNSAILRAMTILLFSATFVIIATLVIGYQEPKLDMLDLAFEVVSAFSTTGLSTGITPLLGTGAKVTLIVAMFVGRIGLLTFGFAMVKSISSTPDYKYPKAKIIIG